MKSQTAKYRACRVGAFFVFWLCFAAASAGAADKLVGIHSARVMSQSMPWMAQEAGLFKKYNLDFNLVFISSSGIVTAALLGGDAEMTVTGGVGNVAAYVRGSTDVVFIGGIKNTMTQTLVAGGNIKKPEDLKGKKIGVSRIGGNSHYFTIQALRRFGMDASRDVQFIQTGGDPETFAAFVSGSIDVANLTPPTDAQAIARGYHYVIYGPDLKIPYAATAFVTKRSVIAKRPQVIGNFMRAMAKPPKSCTPTESSFTKSWANTCVSPTARFLTRRTTRKSKSWSRAWSSKRSPCRRS
jgi:NitT/TauT family transport system substrate-binding protein